MIFARGMAVAALLLQLEKGAAATERADALRKMFQSRNLAAVGVPDPSCHTGVIGLKVEGEEQACCAGYCGECTDYPTCKSVRGQDSAGACCKTDVLDLACGGSAAANVCLKTCAEAVPPCILEDSVTYSPPDPDTRNAGSDCDTAVQEWRDRAKMVTEPEA